MTHTRVQRLRHADHPGAAVSARTDAARSPHHSFVARPPADTNPLRRRRFVGGSVDVVHHVPARACSRKCQRPPAWNHAESAMGQRSSPCVWHGHFRMIASTPEDIVQRFELPRTSVGLAGVKLYQWGQPRCCPSGHITSPAAHKPFGAPDREVSFLRATGNFQAYVLCGAERPNAWACPSTAFAVAQRNQKTIS